jgi:replicative DNA helicase
MKQEFIRTKSLKIDNIPPHSIDTEKSILGIVLSYPEAFNDVIGILKPEMFYKESHQKIYKSALNVFNKINKVDLVTVTNELINTDDLESCGGAYYVTQLCNMAGSISMIENYAFIVKQKYIAREYIRIGSEIQSMAYDGMSNDVSEVAEYAETQILELSGIIQKKEPKSLGKLVDGVIDQIQKIINKEIDFIGVRSGFDRLDNITGGFKKKELIIIAGRPGMGKTALALQIAKNTAEFKNGVGLFSCEMSDESLARRYLSSVSGRSNVELLTGDCNIELLLSSSEKLLNLGIYIDDSTDITITELRAKTRKLLLRYKIKLAIVDYLQLMKGEGQSREQQVSYISRGLKAIAKDLDIPIIALSQINRETESRKDKRPQLSDLRESGAIEQDADMVLLVYRPIYYKIASISSNGQDITTDGLMIVDIAKNRNGAIGEFNLKHNISLTEIVQYEESVDIFKTSNQPF